MRCCCVIPVFNHASTAPAVIERTRAVMPDVLVIDDGSEDINLAEYYAGTDIEVIRHPRNLGKGAEAEQEFLFRIDNDPAIRRGVADRFCAFEIEILIQPGGQTAGEGDERTSFRRFCGQCDQFF